MEPPPDNEPLGSLSLLARDRREQELVNFDQQKAALVNQINGAVDDLRNM